MDPALPRLSYLNPVISAIFDPWLAGRKFGIERAQFAERLTVASEPACALIYAKSQSCIYTPGGYVGSHE